MPKLTIAIILIALYAVYSLVVYTSGTKSQLKVSKSEQQKISAGKVLFQKYNCQSCHQLYGLGGYLGPELTTAYSDKNRGEAYMKALLTVGGARMPNFHFKESQIEALIAYLKYVDQTADPIKQKN